MDGLMAGWHGRLTADGQMGEWMWQCDVMGLAPTFGVSRYGGQRLGEERWADSIEKMRFTSGDRITFCAY